MTFREPPPAHDPMLPADCFAGEVVLVTGGGSGTGLAMAEAFVRCGASVAIASRNTDKLEATAAELRALGGTVLPVAFDVRQPDQIREGFDAIERTLGRVSVLANNAGSNFPVLAENISVNAWRAITQIALDGTFFVSQEYFRRRRRDDAGGAILNNLATYVWMGLPGDAHSAAAKAGQMNLTLTLAAEWARYGIRVNGLAIGNYPHAATPSYNAGNPDAGRARAIPALRALRAQEIGRAAVFLCSAYARQITGLNLVLDGGDWLRRDMLKPKFVAPPEREQLWTD